MGNTIADGTPTSLLIIEDHGIVALGLKTLISDDTSFKEIDIATTAREAIEKTVRQHYDLFIIDVELPDMSGTDLIKSLKSLSPDSAFIFHTIHAEIWTLRQMVNSGANGIVMKSDDPEELQTALLHVRRGDNYYSSGFRSYCEEMEQYQTLSDREIEILQLVAEGFATKDIASRLFVSQNTIEFHRKNIMRKLGVNNMAQLVKEGIAKGYIKVK